LELEEKFLEFENFNADLEIEAVLDVNDKFKAVFVGLEEEDEELSIFSSN
jgi:hypothetical protein